MSYLQLISGPRIGFNPLDAGRETLRLWLSARDHANTALMTDDAASGRISSWTGRNLGGQTFTAATTARPTYDPIGLGGVYPAVVGDGVANVMTMASTLGLPVAGTDSVTIALARGTAAALQLWNYGGVGGGTLRRLGSTSGGNPSVSNGTTSVAAGNSANNLLAPAIILGSWAADLTEVARINGGADTNTTTMASNNTGTTRARLFANNANTPGSFWNGPLAELIVLSGSLATLLPTIQKIEGWLAWQYPLLNLMAAFPSDHPYKAGPP